MPTHSPDARKLQQVRESDYYRLYSTGLTINANLEPMIKIDLKQT